MVTDDHIRAIKHMRKTYANIEPATLIFDVKIPAISTEGDMAKLTASHHSGGLTTTGNREFDRDVSLTPRKCYLSINDMIELEKLGGELRLENAYHAVFIKETIFSHFTNIRSVLHSFPSTVVPLEDLQDMERFYEKIRPISMPFELAETGTLLSGPGSKFTLDILTNKTDALKEKIMQESRKPSNLVKMLYDIASSSKIKWLE